MKIINLNHCPYSWKNGTYGGMAGQKEGILYNDSLWMVKFPKYIKGLERVEVSYSTSPLSEYLGSHIYGVLGFDVHETFLGEVNDKIVVACKDFEQDGDKLLEIRTIRNFSKRELAEQFDLSGSGTLEHGADFSDLLLHMRNNPILVGVLGLEQRFWEQAVVDIYINNSDRNNGNWGILRSRSGEDRLAPVFDNGGSFQDKLSEEKIQRLLRDKENLKSMACGTQTAYMLDGHTLSIRKFLDLQETFPELQDAILRIVPLIQKKQVEIRNIFSEIPETHVSEKGHVLDVCSYSRKELFCAQMDARLDAVLLPAYDRAIQFRELQDREPDEFSL